MVPRTRLLGSITAAVCVAGLVTVGILYTRDLWHVTVFVVWLLCLAGLALLVGALGAATAGSWRALLLSQRNVYSLAQTQFAVWTILGLGSFLALFLMHLRDGRTTDITVPDGLLLLMGVAGGSLVASKAALAQRATRDVEPQVLVTQAEQFLARKGSDVSQALDAGDVTYNRSIIQRGSRVLESIDPASASQAVRETKTAADANTLIPQLPATQKQLLWTIGYLDENATGPLYANATPDDARLTDLIEGDEVASTYRPDFNKVQMLLFTLVAFAIYFAALWSFFGHHDSVCQFPGGVHCGSVLPEFPTTFAVLLGFSHVGYVGGKVAGATRAR